jgi:hypothetical protein
MGGLDVGSSGDVDLDEMDLQFLDTYNTTLPFEFGGDSPRDLSNAVCADKIDDTINRVAIRTEAFRNSYWKFRPNSQDHAGAEEHNLSLPSVPEDHRSPEEVININKRVTPGKLGVSVRDKILTLIIKCCRPENLPKAVASFPSVELLDMLVQYYLTSPVAQAGSFIHAATFDPAKKRPELVAAMVAAGAVLTSDPALTKLGYAIQECVRKNTTELVRFSRV